MSEKHLTLRDRHKISWFIEHDYAQNEMAEELGFAISTISKEIKRNSDDNTYDPDVAQSLSDARKSIPRKSRIITGDIAELIKRELRIGNVPKKISPLILERFGVKISVTSIYNFSYRSSE